MRRRRGPDEEVNIDFKCCKTDVAARGQLVIIGRGEGGLCLVEEHTRYSRRWRSQADPAEPLLVDAQGRAIGYRKYAALLADAISGIGLDPRCYTTHSLRIGGATAAASADIPEFLICQLGRWRSLCVRLYMRQDKRLHASAAALMARGRDWTRPPAALATVHLGLPGRAWTAELMSRAALIWPGVSVPRARAAS